MSSLLTSTSVPPAVRACLLSKSYRLGAISRHTLVEEVHYLWLKLRKRDPRKHMARVGSPAAASSTDGLFWALRDVSFEIQPGEIVGVVGRNGAGKSTLLKLLTRITEPSSGEAHIHGRVASLLEVGTGFHPDLSGRENVYLNGTLLGMKRREITERLPDIIAFSELEAFMDTPVKRYSSGMYVRLAFAVAAHLDPEILLVDEVLAVGDAAFQNKCIGKMSEVASGGRTVFFVSHNLAAVESLCSRALLMEKGRLVADGKPRDVLAEYVGRSRSAAADLDLEHLLRRGNGLARLTRFRICDATGHRMDSVFSGQAIRLELTLENRAGRALNAFRLDVGVDGPLGNRICWLSSIMNPDAPESLPVEGGRWIVEMPRLPLAAGRYTLSLCCLSQGEAVEWLQQAFALDVVTADYYGCGRTVPPEQGHFLLDYQMRLEPSAETTP